MIVRYAKSIKQPVLYSAFVSSFNSQTLELLNESKPFTTYHKDLKEYELTPEILGKIKEPIEYIIDQREPEIKFERTHGGKYGYQDDAVDFSAKSSNVLINFAQGMGKSLTAMKIILSEKLERVLIVCGQGNLQEEWMKDAVKHQHDQELAIKIVGDDTGASNAKKLKWLTDNVDRKGVDLVNIEALRNDPIVDAFNARHYDCIIVDEVQSAKGWKAEQTEGLHSLIRYAGQKRIALSGTPVLNSPLEFFSMLKYFGQLQDTVRTTFEKYYGSFGFDYWGHYICKGYRNLKDLNELMNPIVCYAGKEELGLPEKKRKKVDLDWYSEEFHKLARVYKMSTSKMKKAGYDTKPQVRSMMQFLSSTAEPKMQFVEEHAKINKLLVFSQYTTVLEKYQQHLANKGIKVLYYHGALPMKERLRILQEWRTGNYQVLLLSVMAARYGLNLTEATEVAFLEPPASFAILEQAEDRTHRIGQDKPVTSYLLCTSELDEQALDNIEQKQNALDELNASR